MSDDPYASARETELRARIEGLQQACTEAGRRLGAGEEERDKLRAELAETRAKLARSLELWREWTRTDITENDDLWAEFINRVHALLEET